MLLLPLCSWLASHMLSLPRPECFAPTVWVATSLFALDGFSSVKVDAALGYDEFPSVDTPIYLTSAFSCISIDRLTLRYGLSVDGFISAPKYPYRICHMRV